MREVGTPCADRLHDRGEVDLRCHRHAGARGAPRVVHRARGTQQRFRRHAAGVQAVAAEAMALDDRHARAESRRARRADEPGGAAADDDQVVERRRLRIPPSLRAHLRQQTLVVVHRLTLPGTRRVSSRSNSVMLTSTGIKRFRSSVQSAPL